MKITKIVALPLLLLFAVPAFADSVDLIAGGTAFGETTVSVGGEIGQSFTLNDPTTITSLSVGLDPTGGGSFLGDVWEVSLTNAVTGGTTFWTSGPTSSNPTYAPSVTLAAGTYDLEVTGVACNLPCAGSFAVNLDYYLPASDSATGGSIGSTFGVGGGGGLGWQIQGTTVSPSAIPEPGTVTLLGSGLLGLAGIARRRFWQKT